MSVIQSKNPKIDSFKIDKSVTEVKKSDIKIEKKEININNLNTSSKVIETVDVEPIKKIEPITPTVEVVEEKVLPPKQETYNIENKESVSTEPIEKVEPVEGTKPEPAIESKTIEPAPIKQEPIEPAPATPEISQSSSAPGVVVEDGRQQYYTVTPYDRFYSKWNQGTGQRAVADAWGAEGMNYDHGIATMNVNGQTRYLVATTTTFGNSGDAINIHLKDGTVIPAIIADAKSPGDANWSKFGHTSGSNLNVLEWEVNSDWYDRLGNPTTDKYGLSWDSSSPVVSIENMGNIL